MHLIQPVWLTALLVIFRMQAVTAGKCQKGVRQSPIDIISADSRYQEFRPFTLTGHDTLSIKAGHLYAENYNNTVKLKASKSHTGAILGGGPLNVDYEFVEMHFHWGDEGNTGGSEHTVDNVTYPMELHMVHRNIHDDTVKEALEHQNGLTVLGFKFKIVDDDQHVENAGLKNLARLVRDHLTEPGSKVKAKDMQEGDINVMNFLPVLMDEYFYYRGSLTTGTCDEAVNWIVFKNPLAVKREHLEALQTMKNTEGRTITNNFRPTQPVNDRPIYYHGLDLITRKIIIRGSSVGLRDLKAPLHEQYLLPLPSCPTSPEPAAMWDKETERSDRGLWEAKACRRADDSSSGRSLGSSGQTLVLLPLLARILTT